MSDNPADYELAPEIAAKVRFNDAELVPAIVQAAETHEVLMMA